MYTLRVHVGEELGGGTRDLVSATAGIAWNRYDCLNGAAGVTELEWIGDPPPARS